MVIVFLVVALLGIIFLIASGGRIYKSSSANDAEISEGVKAVKALDNRTPAAPKDDPEKTTEPAPKPAADIDLNAEQEKIMNMSLDDYDDAETRKWFAGNCILGDSITMAAAEYGYLGYDVISAKIGAGFHNSDDLFADAIAKNPSVLFIFLGANDISNYLGDPNLFIDQYKNAVNSLSASLPNTVFYLHGILPEQEGVGYEEGYEYREAYNDALKKYCEETEGLTYINADFMLEQNPDFYDADGIHPTAAFYPRWLTYLADVSGLSGKTETGADR